MMAKILRDYKCEEHGFFEGFYPVCPHGQCVDGISKVYLKPVGLKSDRTKSTDRTVKQLAQDFKMTDIKSTREGESQTGYHTRNNAKPAEPRPGDSAMWGGSGGMNIPALLSGKFARPIADEPVGVNPKDVGNLTGPKTASYIPDHEGLKLDKP